MFKPKQPNNGNGAHQHTHSTTFYRNVLIGAFFLQSTTDKKQIEQTHKSAAESHSDAVKLHTESQEKIRQTEQLLRF